MNKLRFSKLNYDTLKIAETTVFILITYEPESNININFGYGHYSFKGPIKVAKTWLVELKTIVDKKAEAEKNKAAKKDKAEKIKVRIEGTA